MRDVDNNLSNVVVEPSLSGSSNVLYKKSMNRFQSTSTTNNYCRIRDRLWEVIDKEIAMSQCDIYR